MSEPVLPAGTEIVVLDGDFKGTYGIVLQYVEEFDSYDVELPEIDEIYVFDRAELGVLEDEDFDDEETEDSDTPGFGMSANEFAQHLEFLITRTLDRVPTVGPADAFFGYQDWEGLTPEEVLLGLLDKIEDGIAHLAQAHILISRIGVGYRTIMKELTSDDTSDDE